MTEESKLLRIRLALFDSAYRGPGGCHWSSRHAQLEMALLDEFYNSAVSPPLGERFPARAVDVLSGGCVGINHEWCCWFRLFDGGRDLQGRPGRYVMLAAFGARAESAGIDAAFVFGTEVFRQIEAIANRPPPLATLRADEFELKIPILSKADGDMLSKLRRDRRLRVTGNDALSKSSEMCSHLGSGEQWKLLYHGSVESADVRVEIDGLCKQPHVPRTCDRATTPAVGMPAAKITASKPAQPQVRRLRFANLGVIAGMACGLLVLIMTSALFVRGMLPSRKATHEQGIPGYSQNPVVKNPAPVQQLADLANDTPKKAVDKDARKKTMAELRKHYDNDDWKPWFEKMSQVDDEELKLLGNKSMNALAEINKLAREWARVAESAEYAEMRDSLRAGANFWKTVAESADPERDADTEGDADPR